MTFYLFPMVAQGKLNLIWTFWLLAAYHSCVFSGFLESCFGFYTRELA